MQKIIRLGVVLALWLFIVSPALAAAADYVTLVYRGKNKIVGMDNESGQFSSVKGAENAYFVVQLEMTGGTINDAWIISWRKDSNVYQGEAEQLYNFSSVVDEVSAKPKIVIYSFDPFDSLISVGSMYLSGTLAPAEVGKGIYLVPRLLVGQGILHMVDPGLEQVLTVDVGLKLDTLSTQTSNRLPETVAETVARLQAELTAKHGVVFSP